MTDYIPKRGDSFVAQVRAERGDNKPVRYFKRLDRGEKEGLMRVQEYDRHGDKQYAPTIILITAYRYYAKGDTDVSQTQAVVRSDTD